MSTTTIYPSAAGDPGVLVIAMVGIAISVLLISLVLHGKGFFPRSVSSCFGI